MAAFLAPIVAAGIRIFVVKAIATLGIGMVTFAGYMWALNDLKSWILQSLYAMPSDMYNLFLLSGMGRGFGYIVGAWSFVITTRLMNKFVFGGIGG